MKYKITKSNWLKENYISIIKSKLRILGDNLNINSPEVNQLAISMIKYIEMIKIKAS